MNPTSTFTASLSKAITDFRLAVAVLRAPSNEKYDHTLKEEAIEFIIRKIEWTLQRSELHSYGTTALLKFFKIMQLIINHISASFPRESIKLLFQSLLRQLFTKTITCLELESLLQLLLAQLQSDMQQDAKKNMCLLFKLRANQQKKKMIMLLLDHIFGRPEAKENQNINLEACTLRLIETVHCLIEESKDSYVHHSIIYDCLMEYCEPCHLVESSKRKVFVALFNHLKYKSPFTASETKDEAIASFERSLLGKLFHKTKAESDTSSREVFFIFLKEVATILSKNQIHSFCDSCKL